MFSVNIDKIVDMQPAEKSAYNEIYNNITAKLGNKQSISVFGTPLTAFKLASIFADNGKRVMFIDCDFSTSIFLAKYKLGKDLVGMSEIIAGKEQIASCVCKTNKPNLEIIFTGNPNGNAESDSAAFRKLIDGIAGGFDNVIISAGKAADVANKCDGTVLVMDDADYAERTGRKAVDDLEDEGCSVIGIVLENVRA